MIPVNTAEVIQLVVGAILGIAVSFNLDRFGLSFENPKTRWWGVAVTAAFLLTFLLLTDLLIAYSRGA